MISLKTDRQTGQISSGWSVERSIRYHAHKQSIDIWFMAANKSCHVATAVEQRSTTGKYKTQFERKLYMPFSYARTYLYWDSQWLGTGICLLPTLATLVLVHFEIMHTPTRPPPYIPTAYHIHVAWFPIIWPVHVRARHILWPMSQTNFKEFHIDNWNLYAHRTNRMESKRWHLIYAQTHVADKLSNHRYWVIFNQ